MTLLDDLRRYWDEDASTYDNSPGHRPTSAAVQAAWTASLEQMLPPPPSRVLDCGAGTGFLSLIAARLGHRVTALDLSPNMLSHLAQAASADGLEIDVVVGAASSPPEGFDVVMERHLLWTLQDPTAALRAWKGAAPTGRLIVIESVWGDTDPLERVRSRCRAAVHALRRGQSDHHAEYPAALRAALPLGSGTRPARVVDLVRDAGWTSPRLHRLHDVEWTTVNELPLPERLFGVAPRFAVVAT
jgi:SAM-dependent methyltransferase